MMSFSDLFKFLDFLKENISVVRYAGKQFGVIFEMNDKTYCLTNRENVCVLRYENFIPGTVLQKFELSEIDAARVAVYIAEIEELLRQYEISVLLNALADTEHTHCKTMSDLIVEEED